MRVYLVRHGEAAPHFDDSRRPLTDAGAEEIDRLAEALAGTSAVTVAEILHSTKLRAKQTAERLQDGLGLEVPLQEVSYLSPMADVSAAAAVINQSPHSVMIVGHMPHVAKLASMLICGDPYGGAFVFDTGTILCLRRHPAAESDGDDSAPWFVEWMVSPQLIDLPELR